VPLVFFHNSFATKNVKITRDGIAVIDWEQSSVLGLPLVDLQHFLTTYWGGRRGTPYDVTTAALLDDGDPLGFRAALGAYASALELSPELVDVLLVESYLIRARMVTGYRDRVLTCCRHLAEREVGIA
jgi:aminoglycoside phosphotransferase (APT) family kinase protein